MKLQANLLCAVQDIFRGPHIFRSEMDYAQRYQLSPEASVYRPRMGCRSLKLLAAANIPSQSI